MKVFNNHFYKGFKLGLLEIVKNDSYLFIDIGNCRVLEYYGNLIMIGSVMIDLKYKTIDF